MALAAAGAALALWLPRRTGMADYRGIVVTSYVLRGAFGLLLFLFTMTPPSWIGPQVVGPGLWRALPDTAVYHEAGTVLAEAADRDVEVSLADGFSVFIGAMYGLIGVSPLLVILANAVVDVFSLVALLVLTRQVTGAPPPAWLAWTLGLWPSWILWSSQLLKESLLLAFSLAFLLVAMSIAAREDWRAFRRYAFADWFLLGALAVGIAMIRPAVTDVLAVATGLVALVALGRLVVSARTRLAAVGILGLLVAVVGAQATVNGVLRPVAPAEMIRRYVAAQTVPSPSAPERSSIVEGPKEAAAEEPRIGVSTMLWNALRSYGRQVTLARVAAIRKANLVGSSQFGADLDPSTVRGLLAVAPLGLAHTLASPFFWSLAGEGGTSGAVRYLSVIDLPWVYALVVLSAAGAAMSARRVLGRPDLLLLLAYIVVGLGALAVVIPNDGLLFRYRLQFLAPFAAFAPLAFCGESVRRRPLSAAS